MTDTQIKPMKLTDHSIDPDDVVALIENDRWYFEQKMDGVRAMFVITRSALGPYEFEVLASGGGPLKFAAAVQYVERIKQELDFQLQKHKPQAVVIDGELMIDDGEFRMFDLPLLAFETKVLVNPEMPYAYRKNELLGLLEEVGPLAHVETAKTANAKMNLWNRINAAGVEGAVAKHSQSTYQWGVRTKEQLKLKLVKTADVVVTEITNWTSTTGSAEISVVIEPEQDPTPWVKLTSAAKRISKAEYDSLTSARKLAYGHIPRTVLPVGNTSLIGKDRGITVGSVVEVNYLYWTGTALIQPRIMRLRSFDEKQPDECTLEQLPVYSRKAVR